MLQPDIHITRTVFHSNILQYILIVCNTFEYSTVQYTWIFYTIFE
jgi:hypothetical protein